MVCLQRAIYECIPERVGELNLFRDFYGDSIPQRFRQSRLSDFQTRQLIWEAIKSLSLKKVFLQVFPDLQPLFKTCRRESTLTHHQLVDDTSTFFLILVVQKTKIPKYSHNTTKPEREYCILIAGHSTPPCSTAFPNEIFRHILTYCDAETIVSFKSVSRQWKEISRSDNFILGRILGFYTQKQFIRQLKEKKLKRQQLGQELRQKVLENRQKAELLTRKRRKSISGKYLSSFKSTIYSTQRCLDFQDTSSSSGSNSASSEDVEDTRDLDWNP